MTFQVGTRIRTTRIQSDDIPPVWRVGMTGTIRFVDEAGEYADVEFDGGASADHRSDIVNFSEMEVVVDA